MFDESVEWRLSREERPSREARPLPAVPLLPKLPRIISFAASFAVSGLNSAVNDEPIPRPEASRRENDVLSFGGVGGAPEVVG